MKIFSGSKWNNFIKEPKDTGWRDITSELDLSSITGAAIKSYIRRVDEKCHFVFEVKTDSTSAHKNILLLAGSSNNLLRKIGMPKGSALSKPIPALERGTSDFTTQEPLIFVSGSGPGVPATREAEIAYQLSSRAVFGPIIYNIYEVEWVTFDPWPTSLPGTAL